MPQFPPWHRQVAAWPERRGCVNRNLLQAVSEIAARARDAGSAVPAGALGLAGRTRSRCEQLPVRDGR